jgi:hypothetical protein
MADAKLKTLLLAAKAKSCNFVLAMKGTDLALILSKRTISAAQMKEAKTRTDGGKVYVGVLEGGSDGFNFKVADKMPGSTSGLLKKYIKQETGLSIAAVVGKG